MKSSPWLFPGLLNRVTKTYGVFTRRICRLPDCFSEVWIKPCQTYPKVYRDMFKVKPRVTLGLILFTALVQKSKKTVESPKWLSENISLRVSLGSSVFPSGRRPSGKSADPQEFPNENFSRQPPQIFY